MSKHLIFNKNRRERENTIKSKQNKTEKEGGNLNEMHIQMIKLLFGNNL